MMKLCQLKLVLEFIKSLADAGSFRGHAHKARDEESTDDRDEGRGRLHNRGRQPFGVAHSNDVQRHNPKLGAGVPESGTSKFVAPSDRRSSSPQRGPAEALAPSCVDFPRLAPWRQM